MKQLHKKQLYSVNFNINTGKDKFEKKNWSRGGGELATASTPPLDPRKRSSALLRAQNKSVCLVELVLTKTHGNIESNPTLASTLHDLHVFFLTHHEKILCSLWSLLRKGCTYTKHRPHLESRASNDLNYFCGISIRKALTAAIRTNEAS